MNNNSLKPSKFSLISTSKEDKLLDNLINSKNKNLYTITLELVNSSILDYIIRNKKYNSKNLFRYISLIYLKETFIENTKYTFYYIN